MVCMIVRLVMKISRIGIDGVKFSVDLICLFYVVVCVFGCSLLRIGSRVSILIFLVSDIFIISVISVIIFW